MSRIFLGPTDTYAGGHPLLGEGKATTFAPAILPGNIVSINANDGTVELNAFTTGLIDAPGYIAIEQGSGLGANINTPYVAGEIVKFAKPRSGERYRVRAEIGIDISAGTALTVSNTGRVTALTAGDHKFFIATGAPGETTTSTGQLIVVEVA